MVTDTEVILPIRRIDLVLIYRSDARVNRASASGLVDYRGSIPSLVKPMT